MRILIFFILFWNVLSGQNFYFQTITTSDGLSNNSINSLYAHHNGEIWIGTWDGLNIYDGTKIQVFKNAVMDSTSLAGNNVMQILQDKDRNTWILNDSKYISRYNGDGTFKNYLFTGYPLKMELDTQENLVVFLEDNTQYQFHENNFKNQAYSTHNVAPFAKESALKLKIRQLWSQMYPKEQLNAILPLKEHQFLLGTKDNGLFHVELESDRLVIKNNYKSDSPFGSYLTSNEIVDLIKDESGEIWIGFKDGGIARILSTDQGISIINSTHNTLPKQAVRAISKDSDENIYLGYYTQGLYVGSTKDNVFTQFNITRAKQDPDWLRIRSIFVDSNHRVWVGSYAGIMRIDKDKVSYFTQENQQWLYQNRIYSFAKDQNILWIAGWGGLSKFNLSTDQFEPVSQALELSKYQFRKIFVKDDLLLLATQRHGMVIYNAKTGEIKEVNQDSGLIGNSLFDIYYDPVYKQYWIASLGGISILNDQFINVLDLTEKQGLPSHLVYSLNQNDGKIWVSTTKGIANIDMSSKTVLSYNNLAPWQGLEFSEGAYFKDSNNTLLYGGTQGINVLEPSKLTSGLDNYSFKLWIDNLPVQVNQDIIRPYKQNSLTMELYPRGFSNYASTQFEYRIVGLFNNWRNLNQQVQYLDNLSPGVYTIEIRDISSDNKTIVYRKNFSVLAPFYQKSSFVVVVGALLLVMLYFWFRRKEYTQQKKQKILQQKIRERTLEIARQKQDLQRQNNVLNDLNIQITDQQKKLLILHSNLKNQDIEMDNFKAFLLSKLKTPIIHLLSLIEKEVDKKTLKSQASTIYNLIKEWDHLQQIKQLDSHKPMVLNVKEFIEELIKQIANQTNKQEQVLVMENNLSTIWIEIDVLRLKMLLTYIIYESLKYFQSGDKLKIQVFKDQNSLCFNIKSNSAFLKQHWNQNSEYSPYYRAIKTLCEDLHGDMIFRQNKEFDLEIRINNIQIVDPGKQSAVNWDILLEDIKILPKDKINILVFSSSNNQLVVKQIMEKYAQCNLVFAHQVSQGINYLENYAFQGVLIYDLDLNYILQSFLLQGKKFLQKKLIPVFYLCQQVDYILEEQLYSLGVSQILHLPLSEKLFKSKVIQPLEMVKNNALTKQSIALEYNPQKLHVSYDQKLLQQAIKLIHSKYSQPDFNIEQLAKELEISKIKCYRLFKEYLDQAPMDVLIEMRMKHAEFLLNQSKDLTISEISFECGYNDPKYFSKTFKKFFGQSPSTYAKELL
ncbi:helix-turn-helix domain-containing protein [Myroides sp. LJL119]